MTITHDFKLTGSARKPLLEAIEAFTRVKPTYQGAPSMGYAIYHLGVLDKDGKLHFDCDLQEIMDCVTYLEECGFASTTEHETDEEVSLEEEVSSETNAIAENETESIESVDKSDDGIGVESDCESADEEYTEDFDDEECECEDLPSFPKNIVPDTITLEFNAEGVHPHVLHSLLNSKNSLIDAALGNDACFQHEYGTDGLPLTELPIEFTDENTVKFEWLKWGTDSDVILAWSAFLVAALKFCKTERRVNPFDEVYENEKFYFRGLIAKLGLNGPENKAYRRLLMRNLKGNSAFLNAEGYAKWKAKYGSKNRGEQTENAQTEDTQTISEDCEMTEAAGQ